MVTRFMRQAVNEHDDDGLGEIHFPNGVYARGEYIDVDRAFEYLETAREDDDGEEEFRRSTKVKNRKLKDAHVAELVKPMREGKFYTTGDGISKDTQGRVINGQHRLWAIVESGQPQYMVVAHNVPDEAFKIMDEHAKRRFGDVLWAAGDTHAPDTKAAVTKLLYQVITAIDKKVGIKAASYTKPNNDDLGTYYETLNERHDISEIVRRAPRLYNKGRGLTPSAAGASYYLGYSLYNEEFTNAFFEKLATGLGFNDGDPEYALSQKVPRIHQEYEKSSLKSLALTAYTLKALKAARRGKRVDTLRLGPRETFASWI